MTTPRIVGALGGFQNRVVQRITGRQPQRKVDGIWDHPLLETAIQEVVFEDMEEYLLKRQKRAMQYIAT